MAAHPGKVITIQTKTVAMPLHNSNWINEGLPKNWNYGVMHDGRIFFIELARFPFTVNRGAAQNNLDAPNIRSPPSNGIDGQPNHVHGFTTHNIPTDDNAGSSNLVTPRRSLDRYPLARRDPEFPAELQGCLLRMEGALLKQWKKRWFVLAQQHLFCYEAFDLVLRNCFEVFYNMTLVGTSDIRIQNTCLSCHTTLTHHISEKKCLSTYYLPGHTMKSAYGEPGVLKRFSIKIENDQAKTLYVASDDAGDMQVWMNAVGKYSSSNINNINSNRGTADAKFFIEGDENEDDVFSHNPPRRSSSVGSRNKKSLRRSSSRQSALQNISSNFAARHNSEVGTLKSSYSLHNSFNNTLRSSSSKQQLNSPFKLNYTEQRCRTPVYSSSNAFENASNKKSFSSASLQNRNPQHFDQSIDYVNELRGDVIDGATTSQHNFKIQKNYLIKNSLPNTQQQFTDNSFPNSKQPRSSHYDFNKQLQPQQLQSQRDLATPSSTFSVASLNSDRNYFDRNSNFYKSKSAFNAAPTTNYKQNYSDNPGDISTNLNRNNFNNLNTNVNSYPNNNLMIESHLNSQPAYNDILRPKLNKNINVESLNTLKTAASSKTSSKNTYILNNPESENKLSVNQSSSVYDSNMFNNQQKFNRDSNSSYVGKHSTLINQQQQLLRQQQSDWTPLKYNIDAIKEDPDMLDTEVLTSRNLQDLQRKLASHTRLRLSISVQDLMGRSVCTSSLQTDL
ncbi:hypothetical protein HELRODRAFT_160945 [Helobdella robusta]|uniref:PH domain-containing protein n=1 Tax=Helobdella robusta TaxID=6412 RepID=T1EQW4_HELRO|nr:hypothetical protein HELRODRAFT_160945 [Helobdella robusta]ESO01783.1 hypothetical protein HELRODRAFT_160945 [Helobdella robusta]